jgi:hypothetical protein
MKKDKLQIITQFRKAVSTSYEHKVAKYLSHISWSNSKATKIFEFKMGWNGTSNGFALLRMFVYNDL